MENLDKIFIDTKNIKTVNPNQSIQSAIDSITDASEENQYMIFISPGLYKIDSPIIVKEWIHLYCPVPYGAVIRAVADFDDYILQLFSNSSIHGLYLDANYKSKGALVANRENFIVSYCLFQKNKNGVSFAIHNSHNGLILNSIARLSRGDDGFSVEENPEGVSSHISFVNCRSYDHYQESAGTMHGFEVEDGCHHITFENCFSWNCMGIGIHSHTGEPPCHHISIIGGIHCRFQISADSDIGKAYSIFVNTTIDPYQEKNIINIDPNYWSCNINAVENSEFNLKIKNMYLNITNVERCNFNVSIYNYYLNVSNSKNSKILVYIKRSTSQPKSLLTQDALSGQDYALVEDASEFEEGQQLQIEDDNSSEYIVIRSIDLSDNKLYFTCNLVNSYYVANNGKVKMPYSRATVFSNSCENLTIEVHTEGWSYYPKIQTSGIDFKPIRKYYKETLNSNLTIYPNTAQKYLLDANGTDRNIAPATLSDLWPEGYEILITNIGSSGDLIFDPSGINSSILPGESKRFIYDGTQWREIT